METQPSNIEQLQDEFEPTGDPDRLLEQRTAAVDRLVVEAQRELLPDTRGVSLLAVGGYGRQQLFPYSDVDLLLLFGSEKAAQSSKPLIAPFLQKLWDSGLRLSHSVRTP
ncbi:MAG: [protein-PII] uridylyltransferase, partial [Bryobacteraceae bacterium]